MLNAIQVLRYHLLELEKVSRSLGVEAKDRIQFKTDRVGWRLPSVNTFLLKTSCETNVLGYPNFIEHRELFSKRWKLFVLWHLMG